MRVLVVGATGFIGERLCTELAGRGVEVTGVARDPEDADLPDYVARVRGDVTDYDSIVDAFDGQDAVVNLVALSPLFRPLGGDEMHFAVHRDGTENVVRAAEDQGVRKLVQMSGLGADPDGETAFIRSKGEAEDIVRASDLEWTIVRPSIVFGDGGEFIPAMKQLAPPHLTPLPGGGKTRFQPIWVGDIVPMLADIVEGQVTGHHESTGTAAEVEDDDSVDESDDDSVDELDDDSVDESDDHSVDELDDHSDTETGDDSVGESDDDSDTETGDGGDESDERGRTAGDPHVGRTYEIGGPEVLTLAQVARMAHEADGKPVRIVPMPMALAGLGLRALNLVPASVLASIPGVPRMGADQYRSLQLDHTTDHNDVDVFGVAEADLLRLSEYLGVRSVEVDVEAESGP